jgi:hypothetical protein
MFLLITIHCWRIAYAALCIPKRVSPETDQYRGEEAQEEVYFVGHF